MNNLINMYHERAANYGTPIFTALQSYMVPQSSYIFISIMEDLDDEFKKGNWEILPDNTQHLIIKKQFFMSRYKLSSIDMVLAMYAPYYMCEPSFLDIYTRRNEILFAHSSIGRIIHGFANYAQQNQHSAYTVAICHQIILRLLNGEPLHEAIRPHATDYLQAVLFQPQFAPMLMEQLLNTIATSDIDGASPAPQERPDNLPASLVKGLLTWK